VADGIQVASVADVDTAVAAARSAFHGEWSTWTATQRSRVMLKFADLVDKNVLMLAEWESKSMGQPMAISPWLYGMTSEAFRYVSIPTS
jgi:aldehyde dehydrogenase (NAD+)